MLLTRFGASLNKQRNGQSWDHTPHKHDNYTVGIPLSYSPPQPLLFEIKLSTASIGWGAFIPLAFTITVLSVVKPWNGKKDLLLGVNYIVSVTKQSYVKMLIT